MNMTPGQHALLAAGLTAVTAVLFYFILVWPALAGREGFQEQLERLQFQQKKLIETATATPTLEEELAVLSGLEVDRSRFLEQKTHDLAAADLQRRLGLLIEGSGGNLVSSQVLPETQEEEKIFPEITMKMHVRGNIDSLLQILHGFNTGQPLLFTDSLLILKRLRSDETARRDADQLDIRFDATAFIYAPMQ